MGIYWDNNKKLEDYEKDLIIQALDTRETDIFKAVLELNSKSLTNISEEQRQSIVNSSITAVGHLQNIRRKIRE